MFKNKKSGTRQQLKAPRQITTTPCVLFILFSVTPFINFRVNFTGILTHLEELARAKLPHDISELQK